MSIKLIVSADNIADNSQTNESEKNAVKMLFRNLGLILQYKQEILTTPDFYNIRLYGALAGGVFIGTANFCLGDLLVLWEYTHWHSVDKYYYAIIGSPLSGVNTAYWYNQKLQKCERGPHRSETTGLGWGDLGYCAFNYIQHGTFTIETKPIVCDGWKKRNPKCQNTMVNLIEYLKSKERV